MTAFDIFGILFLVLGGTQSLVSLIFVRKNPVSYLFLILGILFIVTGVWMINFEGGT